jgi:hypothetical protein
MRDQRCSSYVSSDVTPFTGVMCKAGCTLFVRFNVLIELNDLRLRNVRMFPHGEEA